MPFELKFSEEAERQLRELEKSPSLLRQCKAVQKTLALMEMNLRHPSLNAHKYDSLSRQFGEEIFEAYAQSKTPGAYRVFWKYGPGKGEITILLIEPHP